MNHSNCCKCSNIPTVCMPAGFATIAFRGNACSLISTRGTARRAVVQGVNFPNSIELISSPVANCTGGWKRYMCPLVPPHLHGGCMCRDAAADARKVACVCVRCRESGFFPRQQRVAAECAHRRFRCDRCLIFRTQCGRKREEEVLSPGANSLHPINATSTAVAAAASTIYPSSCQHRANFPTVYFTISYPLS